MTNTFFKKMTSLVEMHRQFRALEDSVYENHLTPYLDQILKKDPMILSCAYTDLLLGVESNAPQDDREQRMFKHHFFMPWMLYNWWPCEHLEKFPGFDIGQTIAMNYVSQYGAQLTEIEKRFIKEMAARTYFSFFGVQKVVAGEYLVVTDLLLEKTYTVLCYHATKNMYPGDVIFARFLTFEDQHFFVGTPPFKFLSDKQPRIIDFRLFLKSKNRDVLLDGKSLYDPFETDVLAFFYDLARAQFSAVSPALYNTDDELFVVTKSFYTLDLAIETAVEKLLPLTLSQDSDIFLNQAQKDEAGEFAQITMSWMVKGNKQHKSWDNTVMGNVILEPGEIILETNSEERAEKGQKLIEKLLGEAVSFQKVTKEKPEDLLESKREPLEEKECDQEPWKNSPEMKAQIEQMAKAHWDSWFDTKIPALGNKTPKEAAKTKIGREKLEALFLLYTRDEGSNAQTNLFKPNIQSLRKMLGMDE